MFYFKFTEKSSVTLYASVKVKGIDKLTPEQKEEFFERLKRICNFENLEEVSKEEFDKH